jgi:hypothetical protein
MADGHLTQLPSNVALYWRPNGRICRQSPVRLRVFVSRNRDRMLDGRRDTIIDHMLWWLELVASLSMIRMIGHGPALLDMLDRSAAKCRRRYHLGRPGGIRGAAGGVGLKLAIPGFIQSCSAAISEPHGFSGVLRQCTGDSEFC